MSSGESAETWLERGAEAFADMRIDEAALHFEKAVAANLDSAKAHLCLGVIRLFQYQNGVGLQPDQIDWPGDKPKTRAEYQARAERRRAQIEEQNATNAANAEQHLKKSLELQPHYELAIEYLGGLYYWWLDPTTEQRVRLDDAKQWYERVLEINPQHRFAEYACGAIEWEKGFRLVRSNPGFPRPLRDEESRRNLRDKAGPALAESASHFLRSLEIDPNNTDAMTYLGLIRRDQAFMAEPDDARDLIAEATEWHRKVDQINEARAKATGQPWPPGDTATITFERTAQASRSGKAPIPTFPPDSRMMIPGAPPPPPPAFR